MQSKSTLPPTPESTELNPSGLCQCGCQQPAPIATVNWASRGYVRGKPIRYIKGHRNGPTPRPASERFWPHVEKSEGCWLWTASKWSYGHGRMSAGNGRDTGAHRVSWEIHYGPIPDGLHVLHHCDNPSCVRPDHLFLGTHADNMRDRDAKGRGTSGERHPFAKLTNVDAEFIRKMAKAGIKQRRLAELFDVSPATICEVVSGKRWKTTHPEVSPVS